LGIKKIAIFGCVKIPTSEKPNNENQKGTSIKH
jgi:hypothetical protein